MISEKFFKNERDVVNRIIGTITLVLESTGSIAVCSFILPVVPVLRYKCVDAVVHFGNPKIKLAMELI